MKKKFLTTALFVVSIFILTTKSFSQSPPGNSGSGIPIAAPIVIDLGTAGIISIPTTSPSYAFISSVLTSLQVTIAPNGTVIFPTTTCYNTSLSAFYYTGLINYKTYTTCKSQPPPPTHAPKTCG